MTTRDAQLLDLYSDYLIASFGQATATGLSRLVANLSHDQVTRFLGGKELADKDLWHIVKPHVRRVQSDDGVLILDDTVEEKLYTDESELINWHFDHTINRSVKGVNLLSALYLSQNVSLPVSLHLVLKTELFTDPKTGKQRWQSPRDEERTCPSDDCFRSTKTDSFSLCSGRYVVFPRRKNMVYIKDTAKKDFIIPLKTNRNVFLAAPSAKAGKPVKLTSLDFEADTARTLWLEGVSFPVLVSRQVFKNENGTEGVLYLCSSDLRLSASSLSTLYQKRWKVEEYHKSLKSNACFAKSPTRTGSKPVQPFFRQCGRLC